MSHSTRSQPDRFFQLAIGIAILVLGADFAFTLIVKDGEARTIFSDVFSPIVDCLAVATLVKTTQQVRAKSKHLAAAWEIICLAVLSYTIADILWGILELGLRQEPFPSISDVFYLAYYPLLLIGVLLLPVTTTTSEEKINRALDIGIVLVAGTLGYWIFLLEPMTVSNSSLPLLNQIILLAYPVGDLVLFCGLLLIINNLSEQFNPLTVLLLTASLVTTILTDSIYTYQVLQGTYSSGSLLDIGYMASVVFIGIAGPAQWVQGRPKHKAENAPRQQKLHDKFGAVGQYIPYLWLVAAYILLIREERLSLPLNFLALAVGVAGIIGLVIFRQILTLNQNKRLNGRLQETMGRLQTEAAKLEKANSDLVNEVAERKVIEEKLSHDALHDAMTGLANRALFIDRLGQAIEYIKRRSDYSFAVLFIDLDQFKVVNDSLGHLTGDQLLISVSKRLRKCLRSSDTVARFGGDEFAVLLEITGDSISALVVAEKVLGMLKSPFELAGHTVHITASIGVVKDLTGYANPEAVLRDADIAMYQAKGMGKACFAVFNAEMRTQAYSRLMLENELREGIKNHEFQLFYQPILSIESNELFGLESLIRWFHPERGILLPADFLPLAEETGLILSLGGWTIREACLQLKKWQQKYPELHDLSINVNIGNRQFSQPEFISEVLEALNASGLEANFLHLEITENTLIQNYDTATGIFTRLKEIGVELEIDDFGSGYSALGYLQHFPINTIKIDKSFIKDLGTNQRGTEVIRAIISMARELGMNTIAEGIETEIQLSELRNLSCNLVQGFHLSRPLDKDAMEKLLEKQVCKGK